LPRPDWRGFFLFDRLAGVIAYYPTSGRIGWPQLLREIVKMENPSFIPAETLDPRDQQIVDLESQLEHYRRRDQLKAEQLDQLGDAIMAVIGDKVEALAEAKADDAVDGAFRDFNNDFNIYDHQAEIEDMIEDRLPAVQDEDENREAVESIVREILAGATVTIDV
jgi:hypothetical protein